MVAELESGLGAEPDRQLDAIPNAGAKRQDYHRQNAGLLIGGRRVSYVNGIQAGVVERDFAQDNDSDRSQRDLWTKNPVVLSDCGTLTFGVEYDSAAKAFDKFAVNGRL